MMKRILTSIHVFVLGARFAWAGIEPSPFHTEINQLGAAQNILVSIQN